MKSEVSKRIIGAAITGVALSIGLIMVSSCSLLREDKCEWDCPWDDDVTSADEKCKLICEGKEVKEK